MDYRRSVQDLSAPGCVTGVAQSGADTPVMQPLSWISKSWTSKSGFTFSSWNNVPLTRASGNQHVNATTLSLTYSGNWKKLTVEPAIERYLNRGTDSSDDPNTILHTELQAAEIRPARRPKMCHCKTFFGKYCSMSGSTCEYCY